jgi:hypothetical protein
MELQDRIRELKQALSALLPASKEFINNGQELAAVAFLLTPRGVVASMLMFDQYEEKRAVYRLLGEVAKKEQAYGAVLINDSWYLDQSCLTEAEIHAFRRGELKVLASEHPARKEGIASMLCTYGWTGLILSPFSRQGKKIIWGPDKEMPGDCTITNWLFPAFERGVH